jgi:hypothetical protein
VSVRRSARRAALAAALALSGCASHREPVIRPPGIQAVRSIVLHGHRLRVHVADTRQPADGVRPLLVYATGDRGWAGKDLDFYRHLVAWNYPVAGFDAHDYVKHLGPTDTTTPAGLAADYEAIIAAARDALGMRDTDPVVLVGVSHLSGVVAVALTREEEYVKWFGRRLRRAEANAATNAARGEGDGATRQMVQLYEYLPLLRELPITVIQSTNDNYLPAAQARVLFGADTPSRHFVAVEARNHSFAGARDRLYEALHTALDRLSSAMRP